MDYELSEKMKVQELENYLKIPCLKVTATKIRIASPRIC